MQQKIVKWPQQRKAKVVCISNKTFQNGSPDYGPSWEPSRTAGHYNLIKFL